MSRSEEVSSRDAERALKDIRKPSREPTLSPLSREVDRQEVL